MWSFSRTDSGRAAMRAIATSSAVASSSTACPRRSLASCRRRLHSRSPGSPSGCQPSPRGRPQRFSSSYRAFVGAARSHGSGDLHVPAPGGPLLRQLADRKGRPPTPGLIHIASFRAVTGGYFEAMGIRLLHETWRVPECDRAADAGLESAAALECRFADPRGDDEHDERISVSTSLAESQCIQLLHQPG